MIRAAWIVLVKEVTDNFRDRRTLVSALLFGPLFGPLFFAGMVASTEELHPLDLHFGRVELD